MLSDNAHIRGEYNRLRYQIAVLLREIYRVREAAGTDHRLAVKHLKAMRKEVKTSHDQLNDRIAGILRDQHITPQMAPSLLNDFNYVDDTLKNLVDCAKALLSTHEELIAEAEAEINLDEEADRLPAA